MSILKAMRPLSREADTANCHLAYKPVDIEVPQVVLSDIVFEAVASD